ncbi:MAG TPA: cysteine--1-D-myo-inosityl 2-amino-2-deoxy-alpha-D-glucopyranoside ligase [Microbacteriaceae bacterium]|nr:cysteine--1-D-myo-inosityl 2-amino-2-deoxy-alpha-D-glucopyranoside ligase [Microbacteriaceae bacterium]
MRTWTKPEIPKVGGSGVPLKLFNSATGRLEYPPTPDDTATLYVCGITPYDATHIGHAFTYLTFDIMQRAWLDAGITPHYAQNITDIDDPLLERAKETNVNWESLAQEQIALYRSDMFRLGMIPPQDFIAVTEKIDSIAEAVDNLKKQGYAYEVQAPDADGVDIFFDATGASTNSQWRLGDISHYDRNEMMILCRQRGGDPDYPGKRDPIDPLLWRSEREGEPSWDSVVGRGRPGWHIECSVIAVQQLGSAFSVQGGGEDLRFPHHEFSAAHATAATGMPLAHVYCHTALVAYQGSKMSKSRGNLVFVSKLLDQGKDPAAIRLALLAHHYRSEWEWFDNDVETGQRRLNAWRAGYHKNGEDPVSAQATVQRLRQALANDLDTPVMLAALDAAWDQGTDDPEILADACEAFLGISVKEGN